MSRRMRVLLGAYACEPERGSEPGVGWNLAVHLARYCDVWVVTRANNRAAIAAALDHHPVPSLQIVYHDLPSWARWWKKGGRGIRLYYYLWQLTAVGRIRRLHAQVRFDIAHHLTFAKYWAPSAMARVEGVPFVWGPVGGGETAPYAFWPSLGWRGWSEEALRMVGRCLSEHDPLVQHTARRASIALASTPETAVRLRRLGVPRIEVWNQVGLSVAERCLLSSGRARIRMATVFLSAGRLVAFKGFHLGIQAFAASALSDAQYWIVGNGPERLRLERLARQAGVGDRVRFFGALPRPELLALMGKVTALVHPSLRDSGACVCVEAMAAGTPVCCLRLGGPAVLVPDAQSGVVTARNASQAVAELARQMVRLAGSGRAVGGDDTLGGGYSWEGKARWLTTLYQDLVQDAGCKTQTP